MVRAHFFQQSQLALTKYLNVCFLKRWGSVQTPYNRLIKPPPTCNGTAPRIASEIDLTGLPSVMKVADILEQSNTNHSFFSSFATFFTEFLAHDLFSTIPEYVDCECDSTEPECFNIRLSEYFQGEYYRKCINYARNMDSKKAFDCKFDHREQFSNTSHWLDLSNIYGSNYEQAKNFRVYQGGLLRFDRVKFILYTGLNLNLIINL